MFNDIVRAFITVFAVGALLLTMWVTNAHAAPSRDTSFQVAVVASQSTDVRQRAMRCYRRAMVQGQVGESVMVCDVEPSVAPKVRTRAPRLGVTTVTHIGARS